MQCGSERLDESHLFSQFHRTHFAVPLFLLSLFLLSFSSLVTALALTAVMPLLEETTEPQDHPPTLPVVIIGEHQQLSDS